LHSGSLPGAGERHPVSDDRRAMLEDARGPQTELKSAGDLLAACLAPRDVQMFPGDAWPTSKMPRNRPAAAEIITVC